MTYIPEALRQLVMARANYRCEYCLMHEDDHIKQHEIDHIYATKHGGETEDGNLCYSCYFCNHLKGTDLASIDQLTKKPEFLFHPRQDKWFEHFQLKGASIEPRTAQGRVTIFLLQFNSPKLLKQRIRAIKLGTYPPPQE